MTHGKHNASINASISTLLLSGRSKDDPPAMTLNESAKKQKHKVARSRQRSHHRFSLVKPLDKLRYANELRTVHQRTAHDNLPQGTVK